MTEDALPNFEEKSDDEVWRYHQEHADAAAWHGERRSHAKAEILRRASAKNATAIAIDAGIIKVTWPNEPVFDNAGVEGDFLNLVECAGLQEGWRRHVRHEYHIHQAWLKQLRRLGDEWIAAIDKMIIGTTGTGSVSGPSLQEMGGYAPEEEG